MSSRHSPKGKCQCHVRQRAADLEAPFRSAVQGSHVDVCFGGVCRFKNIFVGQNNPDERRKELM